MYYHNFCTSHSEDPLYYDVKKFILKLQNNYVDKITM